MKKIDWVASALDQYERRLISYALGIVGDVETARDVVQDTFLRLCEADQRRVDGHLAQWLYTVCRNRALDVLRGQRSSAVASGNGHAHEVVQETVERPNFDGYALLRERVEALPELEREIVRLKFDHDLGYREISKVVGVSLGTVSTTMARALNRLSKRLPEKADLL